MQTEIRVETTVLPGHRVDVSDPDLPEGAKVDVIVRMQENPPQRKMSVLELVQSLPPGPRAYPTWEEYERRLQEEKNSWER